ncbi:restriction endonuclease subunit S [Tersicoccus sp. Bi-70]|uniref:restriction endonuclease subunit S n=1 Tax=Tersicoccus sp. Bi-70 TaxID=1897634 RepID=UPI000977B2B5|nr:restriction endonuclease subunit S [Tersicoccus sp. Bi-70]OMH36874.1 hypothetical protein BGP79_14115 [Tersicoccus sp. Bi-70]
MSEWTPLTWADLGMTFDGPHATPVRVDEGPYFLNISSLNSGRLDLGLSDHVSEEHFAQWTRRVTPKTDDLLFSYETRLGEAALMPADTRACLGRRMALLRIDQSVADPRFLLYYYLSPSFQDVIKRETIHGATVERISLSTMGAWPVSLPPLAEQRAIAEVLGALDDKIAANGKVAGTLLDLLSAKVAQAMAHGSDTSHLGDIASFHNRLRVPLSSRDRETRTGSVPYYGAAGQLDTVDTHLFDMPLTLVGEDGSVVNDDGSPVTQYVWGPSWVNNHAHVLTGKALSTELLFVLLRGSKVQDLVTGAVQPKLSMGALKRLSLRLPGPAHLPRVEASASSHMALHRSIAEENATLAAIRDALLPQLMSGKLRVREAERTVEALV